MNDFESRKYNWRLFELYLFFFYLFATIDILDAKAGIGGF
jgi:hypothetical protein